MVTTAAPPRRQERTSASPALRRLDVRDPAAQAFLLLWVGFIAAPILFGLDKFFDVLVDWKIYLAPQINDLVPGNAHQAMLAVGVIEIAAGLLVFLRPRVAAYVVAAWLAGIIVNLLLLGDFYDIALRDFGLFLAAVALARLAAAFPHPVWDRRR
ncbi:MAG TPA: hypothetical protein VGK05_04995 [Acidimicrobiia bacterium]